MKIPFINLEAQQKMIQGEINKRIQTVLQHGKYIMGPEVAELEEKLTGFTGAKHVITCSSGTDALLMVLIASDIGPGDAVFTTPFTFIATAEVIALLGATPVFVDIDQRTFNINPDHIESAIQAVKNNDPTIYPMPTGPSINNLTPKAIIPVDLFGLPAEYNDINAIAKQHDLFVLADAAQSLGGEYHGRRVGTLADATATSFFPAKPLGSYGDGGAIFTNNDTLADKLMSIRVHGKGTNKYDNIRLGLNARLDTIQAAILLAKLDIFPDEIKNRQHVTSTYNSLLKTTKSISTPFVPNGLQSAWAQYSLLSDNREERLMNLQENNIPSMIYYPKPLHLQTAFQNLGYKKGDFPVCETICEKIFSLPMHPYLTRDIVENIVIGITGK